MEKRDETTPREKVSAVPGAVPHRRLADRPDRAKDMAADMATDPRVAFEWQAVLLRYLPDPRGSQHRVKRFALR